MRKLRKRFLAFVLAAAMIAPTTALNVYAGDSAVGYAPLYMRSNLYVDSALDVTSEGLSAVEDLTKGTVNIRYCMDNTGVGLTALYTVSDSGDADRYAAFYVNNNTVGLELRSDGYVNAVTATTYKEEGAGNISINDGNYHTLTWIFSEESNTKLYVDGKEATLNVGKNGSSDRTAFFGAVTNLNTMTIGGRIVDGSGAWHNNFYLDELTVYNEPFDENDAITYYESYDSNKLDRSSWQATACCSQGGTPPENAIDNNSGTNWHTKWTLTEEDELPHWLQIDMGRKVTINKYTYLPRQTQNNGIIGEYALQVSTDAENWYTVAEGSFLNNHGVKTISFSPVNAQYVKLLFLSTYGNAAGEEDKYASAAEINIYETEETQQYADYTELEKAYNDALAVKEDLRTEELKEAMKQAADLLNVDERDTTVPQYHINKIAEQINSEIENLSLYTVTYTKYNTTTGKTSTAYIKARYNDQITIVTDAPAGQQFAGWRLSPDGESTEDDPIISYADNYEFYVAGDMMVTATFVDSTGTVTKKPDASVSNVHVTKHEDDENYDVRFVVQLTVPDSYGLYEAGVLWDTQAIKEDILDTANGPQVSETVRKVNVEKVSSSYQYSVTITNVPAGEEIYGVAFAKVYNDSTANFEWLYSPIEVATVPSAS